MSITILQCIFVISLTELYRNTLLFILFLKTKDSFEFCIPKLTEYLTFELHLNIAFSLVIILNFCFLQILLVSYSKSLFRFEFSLVIRNYLYFLLKASINISLSWVFFQGLFLPIISVFSNETFIFYINFLELISIMFLILTINFLLIFLIRNIWLLGLGILSFKTLIILIFAIYLGIIVKNDN